MLTEYQAWIRIAKAFYTPRGDRNKNQRRITTFNDSEFPVHYTGICWGIGKIAQEGFYALMIKKVMTDLELYDTIGWFCATNRPNDILRADYCVLQACIIESESE